ncbi:MAG: ABC transporter permease [Deltaproteobacteria bacterium]|nr:ABC transporter permease [Deltaproteobacteria bacterium]
MSADPAVPAAGRSNSVDLAQVLIWRELTLRYKRSWLGVAWALAEPMMNVVVYVLIFGFVLGARDTVESYPLFIVFGVLPWLFFSTSVDSASTALLDHAPLVRKIAFQRELLVISVVIARFTTLLLGLALAFAWAGLWTVRGAVLHWPSAPLVLLGCVLIVAVTVGLGLGTAALQVILRDTGFLVRFALRLGFYACPIIYPVSRVPEGLRSVYELNPLVGILGCFHSIAADETHPSALALTSAVVGAALIFFGGVALFRKSQPTVSDLI